MEQMTLQSNDFVPYFEYYGSDGTPHEETANCASRSVRAAQIANLDLDYGMVFRYIPKVKSQNPLAKYGFICLFAYHVWNTKNDKLYDSNNQRRAIWGEDDDILYNVGEKTLVYDGTHLNKLLLMNNKKSQKMICKALHDAQLKAAMKGCRNLYIAGFSWNPINGNYMSVEDWNEEMDTIEEKVSKIFV